MLCFSTNLFTRSNSFLLGLCFNFSFVVISARVRPDSNSNISLNPKPLSPLVFLLFK